MFGFPVDLYICRMIVGMGSTVYDLLTRALFTVSIGHPSKYVSLYTCINYVGVCKIYGHLKNAVFTRAFRGHSYDILGCVY